MASRYFQNIFVPLPIVFFNLNSNIDYPSILNRTIDSDI